MINPASMPLLLCKSFIYSLIYLLIFIGSANSSQIKEIQTLLSGLGYSIGPVDGLAGKKTNDAINLFYSDINKSFDGTLDENEIQDLIKIRKKVGVLKVKARPDEVYILSPLRELKVSKTWSVFKEKDIGDFHKKFSADVEEENELLKRTNCEEFISKFKLPWILQKDSVAYVKLPGQKFGSESWATSIIHQKCRSLLIWKHFKDRKKNIKSIEEILKNWTKNKRVKYNSKKKNLKDSQKAVQAYASVMQIGDFSAFYAVYYNDFSFNEKERKTINNFLSNWLMSNDILGVRSNLKGKICNTRKIEIIGQKVKETTPWNNCGSLRLRLGLGAVLLGLRTSNQDLFSSGNRHIEISLAAIDKAGIFVPWARKGAMALSYQRQLPEILTILSTVYASLGYNFYEHQTPNGKKIFEVYNKLFKLFNEPKTLNKYASAEPKYAGIDFNDFSRLSLKEKWRLQQIFLEVLVPQSKGYILKYRPDLIYLLDYEKKWSTFWHHHIGGFTAISGLALYEAANTKNKKIIKNKIELASLKHKNQVLKQKEKSRADTWRNKSDKYAGFYLAWWNLIDNRSQEKQNCFRIEDKVQKAWHKLNSKLENFDPFCAKDLVILNEGKGKLIADRFYNLPLWNQREKVEISYDPSGNIKLEGDLSLYNKKNIFLTTINGKFESSPNEYESELRGVYYLGNDISIKLEKINKNQYQKIGEYSGLYEIRWSQFNARRGYFEHTSTDRLILNKGNGKIIPFDKGEIDLIRPREKNKANLDVSYNNDGDIIFYGQLAYNNSSEINNYMITGNLRGIEKNNFLTNKILYDLEKENSVSVNRYRIEIGKID